MFYLLDLDMRHQNSITKLGKAFLWLSLLLIITFAVIYGLQVKESLEMDPQSFNCIHDSMMKQFCSDPYGASFLWSVLGFLILGSPLLIAWIIIGTLVLIRRVRR